MISAKSLRAEMGKSISLLDFLYMKPWWGCWVLLCEPWWFDFRVEAKAYWTVFWESTVKIHYVVGTPKVSTYLEFLSLRQVSKRMPSVGCFRIYRNTNNFLNLGQNHVAMYLALVLKRGTMRIFWEIPTFTKSLSFTYSSYEKYNFTWFGTEKVFLWNIN